MPRFRFLIAGLFGCGLSLTAGCDPPRLDGSSSESFQASYVQVRGALAEDEQERFEKAIRALGAADLDGYSAGDDSDAATRSILMRLDGMSAAEILREAAVLDD